MKPIEDILSTFTDTELAYLFKYQINTYLFETKTKIRNYIFIDRGLQPKELEELILKNRNIKIPNDNKHCPRCKSNKIRIDKTDWAIPLYKAGAEDEYAMLYEMQTGQTYYKDKITCNVCGYILYDPNNEKRPFYKKLKDFLFDNPVWTFFEDL
jgi:rubredoxin